MLKPMCEQTHSNCPGVRRKSSLAAVLAISLMVAACSPSASDSLQEGKSFVAKGDVTSAVISFKNAVQKEPELLQARLALAEALESSDDLAGAEQQYRRALALGGDANEIVPKIAILLLDRGDVAPLIKEFAEEKLTDGAADANLRSITALAYLALGKQNEAKEQLDQAEVKTAAVHIAQSQSALAGKRPQEALSELEAAVKDKQAPWWVWRAASRLYALNGDNTHSFAALQHAYELAPWHHGVIGEYAEKLIAAGRSAEVKPLRDKLHKIAPTYFRTQYIDALFLMNEGKQDEAWTLATRILAKLPEHMPSQMIAATVELKRGELASADTRITKILSHNPNALGGLRLRTLLELQRGNMTAAATTLQRALQLAPNDGELLAISADLNWQRGEKGQALKQMEAAALAPPPQSRIQAKLGEMYLASGKRNEALAAIDKAIELSKTDTENRDEVFRTIFRMHLPDKAKAMAQADIERHPKDPVPVLWMAAILGTEGNEAGAFEQTKHALDLRPDYYPALSALAMAAKSPERTKEYDLRIQKAIEAGSKDARVYIEHARKLRLAGTDPERVGEIYAKGIKADPSSIKLREEAIRYWLTRGRKDKALALAKDGEAALADNPAMIATVASTLEATGDLQQAAQKYAQLTARYPERVDLNMAHAQILARSGKAAEAIEVLRKLVNLRAEEPAPYQMLAMLQVEQGKAADAQLTAAMLRDKPKLRIPGLLLLGDVLVRMDRKQEALKAYDEAGKAGAEEAALLRKVELQDRIGDKNVANDDLREWLAAHPKSIAALSLAAHREVVKADFAAAARYYELIVKQDPKNFVALNELAWSYVKAKNPASLATAKAAAELAPEHPTVLDTLADAQSQAGQKNEAMATLRQALSIAPGAAIVRVHLAELLADDGKKKEASEILTNIEERGLDKDGSQRLKAIRARL